MLPYLSEMQNPSKKYTVLFRGLNYGEGAQDGEFAETVNLSTEKYPCMTTRAARIFLNKYERPTAIHSKDKLVVVDGTDVKYGDKIVGTVKKGKKQIATIGNYVVIFPDKKYYNTGEDKFGSLEEKYSGSALVFTENTITKEGANFQFREGDAISITGCTRNTANNKTAIVQAVSADTLTFDNNTFVEGTEGELIRLSRSVPDLDFICENNYRLWGTHGNTIYASKFSDPFNFQVFEGLASDSYYIDVGSEGEFTGCIPYSSHICFFKENTLHKLYGTKPSNFQITTANVYGVQKGSEKSMYIVNEQLLYKGVNGVYSYTGGVPELISEKLGNKRFSDAVACCDGETYYISMKHGDEYSFFAYDVLKNIWLREDSLNAIDMTFHDGKVYFLDDSGNLFYIDKTADRSDIEWGAQLCTFHETINERKGYSKFHLRLDMEEGAWLSVSIKTDNDNTWKQVYTTHSPRAKTITIPIVPTRCDSIDIKLNGRGVCTIKALVREFTTGSDV